MVSAMTTVFTEVFTWLKTALTSVLEVFYNSSTDEFTILGVLAVIALAVSVFFLIVGVISNFMHLRS